MQMNRNQIINKKDFQFNKPRFTTQAKVGPDQLFYFDLLSYIINCNDSKKKTISHNREKKIKSILYFTNSKNLDQKIIDLAHHNSVNIDLAFEGNLRRMDQKSLIRFVEDSMKKYDRIICSPSPFSILFSLFDSFSKTVFYNPKHENMIINPERTFDDIDEVDMSEFFGLVFTNHWELCIFLFKSYDPNILHQR